MNSYFGITGGGYRWLRSRPYSGLQLGGSPQPTITSVVPQTFGHLNPKLLGQAETQKAASTGCGHEAWFFAASLSLNRTDKRVPVDIFAEVAGQRTTIVQTL